MDSQIEEALRDVDPVDALRRLVVEWKEQRRTQREIYKVFVAAHAFLNNADREVEADSVAAVADCIVGWCAPHMKLFDTTLEL